MPEQDSIIHPPSGPTTLPVGVSSFSKLIREGYTFVDKSLFIKDFINDGAEVAVITRPRRFGKTLNLSMLHHFFADEVRGRPTRELFEGLAIGKYDTPIHAAYLNGYYQQMIDLMRTLLGGGLKYNGHLYKAVVTGILRVSKESLFSGVNNLEIYSVIDREYSQYFGFLEAEVAALSSVCNVESLSNEVQSWYNGYRFGDQIIYNPWSILGCLKRKGEMRSYWVNTSDNALLKELMVQADAEFKQDMESLLQNNTCEQIIDPNLVFGDLRKSAMPLWSLLLFSGYLTADDVRHNIGGRAKCRLRVPNLEVMGRN